MDLVIRNCRLRGIEGLRDISSDNGVIKEIDKQISLAAEREIDAGGRLVTPPFIDPHVHLDAVRNGDGLLAAFQSMGMATYMLQMNLNLTSPTFAGKMLFIFTIICILEEMIDIFKEFIYIHIK